MPRSIIATRPPAESPKSEAREPSTALDQMAAMWGPNRDDLTLTQEFVEFCQSDTPTEKLVSTFQLILERLGFQHFACCSHVDPLHPPRTAVVLHNYPEVWARAFSELTLHEIDPVLLYAEQRWRPFSWDDAAFRAHLTMEQKVILAEGASLGLAHGYTIPINCPRECGAVCASCSVVPDTGAIDSRSYFAVQIMANYLYHAASRQLSKQPAAHGSVALTLRERQCLELAAHGKSDWVIGRVLGLSESTVHTYIERAKQRMGVATRVQAIVQALTTKQISYGEIVRSEKTESFEYAGGSGVHRRALEIRNALLRELERARIPV